MEYIKLYAYHIVFGYGMLLLLIFGINVNNEGLINISIFWFWVNSILNFISLSKNFSNEMVKQIKSGKKTLPIFLYFIFLIIAIGTFIYNGFIWLSIISSISSIVMLGKKYEINEILEKDK